MMSVDEVLQLVPGQVFQHRRLSTSGWIDPFPSTSGTGSASSVWRQPMCQPGEGFGIGRRA
jgi:hypothetical protein